MKRDKLFVYLFCHIIFCAGVIFLNYLDIFIPILNTFYSVFIIVYLTIFLGYQFLDNFLEDNPKSVQILLSVALSLSILMISGFILNMILPVFEINKPINIEIQFILINFLFILAFVINFFYRPSNSKISLTPQKLRAVFKNKGLIFLPFFILFPILGWHFQEIGIINYYAIFLILLIIAMVVYTLYCNQSGFDYAYIYFISLGLLYSFSLNSNLIFGYDIHFEYFTANQVLINQIWDPIKYAFGTNQMLSSTILPSYYVNLANIDLTTFFKFVYPMLFAFLPVGLYEIFLWFSNRTYALIGIYFFIFQITFFTEMTMLFKQAISEIFLIALLICFFNIKKDQNYPKYLIPIFSFSLIASHYGFSTIVLIYFIFFFLIFKILNYFKQEWGRYKLDNYIYLYIILFLVYFIYIALSGFKGLIEIQQKILNEFGSQIFESINPFNPYTHDSPILSLLDVTNQNIKMSFIRYLNSYIIRFTQLLILIGSIKLFYDSIHKKSNGKNSFLIFIAISLIILIFALIVPYFSQGLNMTRTYHITLIFLAITIPYGIQFITDNICKAIRIKSVAKFFSVFFVIVFLLFQTGVMGLVFNEYNSPNISQKIDNPAQFYGAYTHESEKYGAEWISQKGTDVVFSDSTAAQHVLTSYGNLFHSSSSYYQKNIDSGYLYLRNVNINYDVFPSISNFVYSPASLKDIIIVNNQNLVYNNGYCENVLLRE
jgi:uncharacterized membrane protein